MERRSSRIFLWALAVIVGIIVVAGGVLTIYIVSETSNARADRCQDVVQEREGDRLLWAAILGSLRNDRNGDTIDGLLAIVDKFKPPLRCGEQNIPVEVSPEETSS